MDNVNSVIAKNLVTLRKKSNLTQLQLAEKLNYSDKAISKWEKGEALPNINVLMALADFYEVKIQDIVYEHKVVEPKKSKNRLRGILISLSSMMVWLIATIVFVALTYTEFRDKAWYAFIIALPMFFLVITIFLTVWKNNLLASIFASLMVWSFILMISLILEEYQVWMVYLIGLPLQIIIVLAGLFVHFKNKNKAS